MDNREDTNLRVFNTAKVFAEQILFPLMFNFKKYQRQVNYGCENLDNARLLSEDIKDIERYNGLKAMAETCCDLLDAISSTVRLKGNKWEIIKLEEIRVTISKIKLLFYDSKHLFFTLTHKGSDTVEVLDRDYFEKIKRIVDVCYINTEILMTKNKLLFADAKEDFLSDEEIKEQIKKEYIEG